MVVVVLVVVKAVVLLVGVGMGVAGAGMAVGVGSGAGGTRPAARHVCVPRGVQVHRPAAGGSGLQQRGQRRGVVLRRVKTTTTRCVNMHVVAGDG